MRTLTSMRSVASLRTLPGAMVAVSACYMNPSPGYATQPASSSSEAAQPQSSSAPPAGPTQRTVWQGSYTCAQGVTSLQLTLDGSCNGVSCSFAALFEFGPLAENPSVPRGAYRLAGEGHANNQGELELSLTPTKWVQQPASYLMIGMYATADAGQQQMHGRMDNPSCGELALSRVK